MNISMYRKLLGYQAADKKQPIYAAMPGALVTQAFIRCCKCGESISHNMGPRSNAYCIPCTEEKIVADAKAKKEVEEEKNKLAKIKEAIKKKLEEEAKRKEEAAKDA